MPGGSNRTGHRLSLSLSLMSITLHIPIQRNNLRSTPIRPQQPLKLDFAVRRAGGDVSDDVRSPIERRGGLPLLRLGSCREEIREPASRGPVRCQLLAVLERHEFFEEDQRRRCSRVGRAFSRCRPSHRQRLELHLKPQTQNAHIFSPTTFKNLTTTK